MFTYYIFFLNGQYRMLNIERIIQHKCINLYLTESVLQKLDIEVKFNIEKSLHELYNTSRMQVDECNKSTYLGIMIIILHKCYI